MESLEGVDLKEVVVGMVDKVVMVGPFKFSVFLKMQIYSILLEIGILLVEKVK